MKIDIPNQTAIALSPPEGIPAGTINDAGVGCVDLFIADQAFVDKCEVVLNVYGFAIPPGVPIFLSRIAGSWYITSASLPR